MPPEERQSFVSDLTIKVQEADGDVMFRQADNIGLGDNSCVFSFADEHKDQVMRRGEYIFAIGKSGKILNRFNFPRNREALRDQDYEIFARLVFWKTKIARGYTDPIYGEVKFLVWASVEAWHEDTKTEGDFSQRFGKFHSRNVELTIYTEPAEGFHKVDEDACMDENLCVNQDLLLRAVMRKHYEIIALEGRLRELCRTFEDEVYFKGMMEVVDKGKVRGASGDFNGIEVLSTELCDYHRVSLKAENCWISFQLRPEAKHMYPLGMNGTIPQLRNLVKAAVKAWNDPQQRVKFVPDENVSVM